MILGKGKRLLVALMLAGLALAVRPLAAQEAATETGAPPAETPMVGAGDTAGAKTEEESAPSPRIAPEDLESMRLAWIYERDGRRRLAYVVQSGDTLWDIAGKYLNSNYYWPKIWERNTFIVNPHLIFPGDLLYLYPDGVIESPADHVGPGTLDGGNKITYKTTDAYGFVDLQSLEQAGKIIDNKMDKTLLGENDIIYVNLGKVDKIEVGETFTVFRLKPDITDGEPQEIQHPITGDLIGYQTVVLGELRITKVLPRSSEGVIQKSYLEIYDGDLLTPYLEPVELVEGQEWISQVSVVPTELEELKACIVATRTGVSMAGNNDFVYLDKGATDGLVRGNVFTIYKPCEMIEDRVSKDQIQIPEKIFGHVIVIQARELTSVALITDTDIEVGIGERLLLSKYNRWEIEGISSSSDINSCSASQKCKVITADQYANGTDRPFCTDDIVKKSAWDRLKPKSPTQR